MRYDRQEEGMTIKDVEEQLGITRANIRFYEKEGLLFPKRNPINDYRNYSAEDLETLKKIMFLRELGVPVESIRLLIQGREDLNKVISNRLSALERQQEKTGEAIRFCRRLLSGKPVNFAEFSVPEELPGEKEGLLKDSLSILGNYWGKILVWGLFAVQILLTLIVYPQLPGKIPVEWQGAVAVEYRGKAFILSYLWLSVICVFGMRLIMYQWLDYRFRCYMDEITAVATGGGIGVSLVIEIYTFLSVRTGGAGIGFASFLAMCAAGYFGMVLLTVFVIKKRRKDKLLNEKKR